MIDFTLNVCEILMFEFNVNSDLNSATNSVSLYVVDNKIYVIIPKLNLMSIFNRKSQILIVKILTLCYLSEIKQDNRNERQIRYK